MTHTGARAEPPGLVTAIRAARQEAALRTGGGYLQRWRAGRLWGRLNEDHTLEAQRSQQPFEIAGGVVLGQPEDAIFQRALLDLLLSHLARLRLQVLVALG